jgi:hypothetical protein
MDWIARQSFARALLIAAAWPLALVIYAAAVLARLVVRDGTFVIGFGVSSWSALALVLLGPSVFLLTIWWFARLHRGLNGQGHR